MNSSPCLWVFLLTITSATIGQIEGDSYTPAPPSATPAPPSATPAPPSATPAPPRCLDDTIWRDLGDRWTPLPCYNCECVQSSGQAQIVCEDQPRPCEEPKCDNPYDLPGQEHCHCPVCPPSPPTTTTSDGSACNPGDSIPSSNPCSEICECNNGRVECFEIAVDCFCGFITQCQCEGLYVPEGGCCPRCPSQDCSLVHCAQPRCDEEHQLTEPGACCPRCDGPEWTTSPPSVSPAPPSATPAPPTTSPSSPRCNPGDSIPSRRPCSEICECNNGLVECFEIDVDCFCGFITQCQCEGLYVPEGGCCPRCPSQDCSLVRCAQPRCDEEHQLKEPGACCPRCDGPEWPSATPAPPSATPAPASTAPPPPSATPAPPTATNAPASTAPPPPRCNPGDSIPSRRPCSEICECNNGFVECFEIAVDCFCGFITQCQCEGLYVPEGGCCPRCPSQDCSLVHCAQPRCDEKHQLTEPGACCPRCDGPEWTTSPPSVTPAPPSYTPAPSSSRCLDGTIWRDGGERWTPLACYNCECVSTSRQAQIICEDQPGSCQEPKCDNPYDLPGQEHCHCPVCPPSPPTTTTLPGPACVPGETFKPDQCTTCTCENDGSMSCVGTPLSIPTGCPKAMMTTDECGVQHCPDCSSVVCAELQCPEAQQLTLQGECCPICDGPQSECQLGKRRKLAGDPCTRCKCKAGDNGITQEVCKTKTCPELSCTETYTLKRNCCPQCAPVCSGVVCPQLLCPQRFQKQKKNACCPRCTRCEGVVCESPECPEEFQKTKRGECCPTCKRKWLRIQKLLE